MLATTTPQLSRFLYNTTYEVVASPINKVLDNAIGIFESFLEKYSPEHYQTKSPKEKQFIDQTFSQLKANYDRFVRDLPNLNSDSLHNLKQVLKTKYGVNVDTGKLTWSSGLTQSVDGLVPNGRLYPVPVYIEVISGTNKDDEKAGYMTVAQPDEGIYESIEFAQLQNRVSNLHSVPSAIQLGIEVLKTNGTQPGCKEVVEERLLKVVKNRMKKRYYSHLLAYINNPTDDMKDKIARFLNKLLNYKEKNGIYIAVSG